MSASKISFIITFMLAAILSAVRSEAQIVTGASNAKHFGPFIEPDTFTPDFQFFAPAEASDYGDRPAANRGYFFTYDRLYMNVGRPKGRGSEFDGDFTWGNRLEFGFIDDSERGWDMVTWHIDGPNIERSDDGFEGFPLLRVDGTPFERRETVNQANLAGFEINRVMERKYFQGGAVLEPFIGARFIKFDDTAVTTNYQEFDLNFNVIPDTDILFRGNSHVQNNMLGGQLGFRVFKESGHWKLNTEVRFMALNNFQFITGRSAGNRLVIDDSDGTLLSSTTFPSTFTDDSNTEFVWGGEIRSEAAYQLTRDIGFRFGFAIMDLGKGVGRVAGATINPAGQLAFNTRNQDQFIGGLTFGFEVNR